MSTTEAKELANETGKPWLLNPDWAGGAQPLAHYAQLRGTPSVRGLAASGFRLILPDGISESDLLRRNELVQ